MVEAVRNSHSINSGITVDDVGNFKTPDRLDLVVEKALKYFNQPAGKTEKTSWPVFSVSDLTREERVIVRDKIKVVRPDWNIRIDKFSWDMMMIPQFTLTQSFEPSEAREDSWQETLAELERGFLNGKSQCYPPDSDYDKQMELVKWLKEKKPHWQISIVERCIFDSETDKVFPGKMIDVLVVKAELNSAERQIMLDHRAKIAAEYFTSFTGIEISDRWIDISDLTREERVIVRDKIKAIRPEWNLIIAKEAKNIDDIPAKLRIVSPLQALEPGKDFWQHIAESLEQRFHEGKSSYDVTGLEYEKQMELLGWLKEKRPQWHASIVEENRRDGVSSHRFFPGEMLDILTVKNRV